MENAEDSENKKNAELLVKHFILEMPISKAIENLMKFSLLGSFFPRVYFCGVIFVIENVLFFV